MTIIILVLVTLAAGVAIGWLAHERKRYKNLLDRALDRAAALARTVGAQRETITFKDETIEHQETTTALLSLALEMTKDELAESRRALMVQVARQEGIALADL